MKVSPSLFAAFVVLASSIWTTDAAPPKPLCCPDDDFLRADSKEYFDECEGCYKIGDPTSPVQTREDCASTKFYNFPGGFERRLKDLGEGARIIEISGEKIVEFPDGRRILPYRRTLPETSQRALLVGDIASDGFNGKVTTGCSDDNDLCCCDYTGSGELPPLWIGPYEYEECVVSCYFFDNNECALLNTDPSAVAPRPLDVLPTCPGFFRAEKCEPGLGLGGRDPHFRSWAGEWYDFHGECSLVLLTTPRSALGPIDIHIRTKIRYDYSFVESAVLKLGNNTLEVTGWGQYVLDGVLSAAMPAKLAGYPVTYKQVNDKEHVLEVQLSHNEHIILSTFKDWVTITVENATYKNFQGSLGLMGMYPHGKLVGRDGFTTFQDHNDFGEQWQVLDTDPMLFQSIQGPQYPERCAFPTKGHLRPGKKVSREAAKKACTDSVSYEGHLELCIADVMTSGDVDIAQAK